ncbi:MAG: polysaccharide deacetylase family protein, partial [Candidatus Dormibacteraceae bacterium]
LVVNLGLAVLVCLLPEDTLVPVQPISRPPAEASGPVIAPVSIVPNGRPSIRVPILMYHYIRINPVPSDWLGFGLSVTPADFAAQMDWLARNGYHPIDISDLRRYFTAGAELPARPVVITLDDGSADLYTTAYPILHAHYFKAVAYIVSGFLDEPNRVTREQVVEMDHNGIEIAAHTVSHLDMTKLSADQLHNEVFDCKVTLEGLLGHPVLDFAYPAGRFNPTVEEVVAAAGFQTAVTTRPGMDHSWDSRLTWTRVRVEGGEPLLRFIVDLGPSEDVVTKPLEVWRFP